MRSWKVNRTITSAFYSAASNFARIARDLFSQEAELKLIASSSPNSATPAWNTPHIALMRHFLTNIANPTSTSKSKAQSPATGTLASSIAKAVEILLEDYDNTSYRRSPMLVLTLFDPSEEFDESWTYTDTDGAAISINDYIESLITEHNGNLQPEAKHKRVKTIDVSILVFVAEAPIATGSSPQTGSQQKKRAASESPQVSDDEEDSAKKPKLQESSPGSQPATSRSAFKYSNEQFCFCNGSPLPKSRLDTGFEFVRSALSFVRPSYASQAISDLACSIYNLKEIQISEIPTRNSITGEQVVLSAPAHFFVPQPSQRDLQSYMVQKITTAPYIGHHLGAGSWKTLIKYSVRRWALQYPPVGFSSHSALKVTPKSLRNASSGSLLASVTDRRPMLVAPLSADEDATDQLSIFICEGPYVYLYDITEGGSKTELGRALPNLPRVELLSRSSRLNSMCGLMNANTFSWTTFNPSASLNTPLSKHPKSNESIIELRLGSSAKSIDLPKAPHGLATDSGGGAKYRTTRGLELATRIFPVTDDSSLLYAFGLPDSLAKHITPIVAAVTSPDIPPTYHPMLIEHVKSLSLLAAHNDVASFPFTKTAVAKRRELYQQLWTELLTLVGTFSDVSAHHKLFTDLVRHSAPDPALATSILPPVPETIYNKNTNQQAVGTSTKAPDMSAMDVDSDAAKASEKQWLKDVESARHDIVGLKDASWAPGAAMHVPDVPLPTIETPPDSLYSRYWNAAKERKGLGTHLTKP